MLKRLLHIHWFTRSWSSFGYDYEQCRCGARRAQFKLSSGYAPCARWWLEGRDSPPSAVPPQGGSGLVRLPKPLPTGVPGSGVAKHV